MCTATAASEARGVELVEGAWGSSRSINSTSLVSSAAASNTMGTNTQTIYLFDRRAGAHSEHRILNGCSWQRRWYKNLQISTNVI